MTQRGGWSVSWPILIALVALAALISPVIAPVTATAQPGGEPVAMITEIKLGSGNVDVRPAGGVEWRPAGPLMSLVPGDTVRATGTASAVVLLSGGRGTLRVAGGAAPVVIPARGAGQSKLEKAQGLLTASFGYLGSQTKELPQAVLGTRGWAGPPVVLAPRGQVLADALSFEWLGTRFARYDVQIAEGPVLVLERRGIVGTRFEYPADAPALRPGVQYKIRVYPDQRRDQRADTRTPEEASFQVVPPDVTQALRANLAQLERELGSGVPPSTRVAIRAGVLANQGLYHEARATLLAGLAKDADEPTLHLLLGNVYDKTGLDEQAKLSYEEARYLLSGQAAKR
jgi:hypothetical protein